MEATQLIQLIRFLRCELAIPPASIRLALRHPESDFNVLPIILWQYGLITLAQLDRIFEWMEHRTA